jgi:hypothetical protein
VGERANFLLSLVLIALAIAGDSSDQAFDDGIVIALGDLLELKAVCATFPDLRKRRGGNIAVEDFGLSAFGMFFMQSASFLTCQRTMEKGHGRSNCQTLLAIGCIPSDNYIREFWMRRTPRCCSPASNAWKRCWPSRRCGRPSAGWAEGP